MTLKLDVMEFESGLPVGTITCGHGSKEMLIEKGWIYNPKLKMWLGHGECVTLYIIDKDGIIL